MTLVSIKVEGCSKSVVTSAREILEEQRQGGNDDLIVDVFHKIPSLSYKLESYIEERKRLKELINDYLEGEEERMRSNDLKTEEWKGSRYYELEMERELEEEERMISCDLEPEHELEDELKLFDLKREELKPPINDYLERVEELEGLGNDNFHLIIHQDYKRWNSAEYRTYLRRILRDLSFEESLISAHIMINERAQQNSKQPINCEYCRFCCSKKALISAHILLNHLDEAKKSKKFGVEDEYMVWLKYYWFY